MPPPKDPDKREVWIKNRSGEMNYWYGKTIPEEIKIKMRKNHANVRGENNPMYGRRGKESPNYGRKHTQEERERMSKSLKEVCHTKEWNERISMSKQGRCTGDKHPLWKGGVSFEPYCIKFNKEFKERVRAFFNYTCVECGKKQEDNYTNSGKFQKLTIHHVNFRKDSCCAEDAPKLFVPLCNKCHPRTNFIRPFWEYWFTEMINHQYNGKCYYTKEEYNGISRDGRINK